jgi:hypothetical protein
MGGACGTHGRDEKMHSKFWSENPEGKNHSEDLGIDGRDVNIRMEFRCEDVDWTHIVRDRDQWRNFVNTIMNLRFPCKVGYFLTSCVTISF